MVHTAEEQLYFGIGKHHWQEVCDGASWTGDWDAPVYRVRVVGGWMYCTGLKNPMNDRMEPSAAIYVPEPRFIPHRA